MQPSPLWTRLNIGRANLLPTNLPKIQIYIQSIMSSITLKSPTKYQRGSLFPEWVFSLILLQEVTSKLVVDKSPR